MHYMPSGKVQGIDVCTTYAHLLTDHLYGTRCIGFRVLGNGARLPSATSLIKGVLTWGQANCSHHIIMSSVLGRISNLDSR